MVRRPVLFVFPPTFHNTAPKRNTPTDADLARLRFSRFLGRSCIPVDDRLAGGQAGRQTGMQTKKSRGVDVSKSCPTSRTSSVVARALPRRRGSWRHSKSDQREPPLRVGCVKCDLSRILAPPSKHKFIALPSLVVPWTSQRIPCLIAASFLT